MGTSRAGRFDIALDDLERQVHVPFEEQMTEQPEPPTPAVLAAEELDRQRLLGITGAGRLRLH